MVVLINATLEKPECQSSPSKQQNEERPFPTPLKPGHNENLLLKEVVMTSRTPTKENSTDFISNTPSQKYSPTSSNVDGISSPTTPEGGKGGFFEGNLLLKEVVTTRTPTTKENITSSPLINYVPPNEGAGESSPITPTGGGGVVDERYSGSVSKRKSLMNDKIALSIRVQDQLFKMDYSLLNVPIFNYDEFDTMYLAEGFFGTTYKVDYSLCYFKIRVAREQKSLFIDRFLFDFFF